MKFKKPNKDRLNIGCGNDAHKDYINLDIAKLRSIDVVHDLNRFPYPFPNNSFSEVRCFNILEHLDDLEAVMKEIHRICKKDAVVRIKVPHFSSADSFTDPTHKRFFSKDTFNYFSKEFEKFYHNPLFEIIKNELYFPKQRFFIKGLANKFKGFYEHNISFIFPASYIYFELKPIK